PGVRKIPDPTRIPTTMASPSNRRSDRLRSDTAGRICRKKRRGAALLRPCAPTTVQAAMDLRVSPAPAPSAPATTRRAGRPAAPMAPASGGRSEEHTSELQSRGHLVCRLLLEKKKKQKNKLSHDTVTTNASTI